MPPYADTREVLDVLKGELSLLQQQGTQNTKVLQAILAALTTRSPAPDASVLPSKRRHFEAEKIILTSTTVKRKIMDLYGGHAMVLWADDSNSNDIYIGGTNVSSTMSMALAKDDSLPIDLTMGIPPNEFISVYALAESANDTLWMLKV